MSPSVKQKLMFTLAILMVLVAGCSPPQEVIDQARTALSEAEALEPERYAPEAWQGAQQAMRAVDAELQSQEEKFVLFRSYKKTGELLAEAQNAAEEARQATTGAREAAQEKAQSTRDAISMTLDDAQGLIAELELCKRKPKGFAADLEVLAGSLAGLRAQLPEVDSMLAAQDFLGASSMAEGLLTQAEVLSQDLAGAKTKLGC